MKPAERKLFELQGLAQLQQERDLAVLRRCADELARSKRQLAALDQNVWQTDLAPTTADIVACAYRCWADTRKIELNSVLSRQMAEFLTAQEQARQSFARLTALNAVAQRKNGRK